MESIFQQACTVYASSPTEQTTKYQHGGNLLSITHDNIDRVSNTGHNPMRQYDWATMQGKWDKGIFVIVAYRVCQDHNSKAGAFTAYLQQYTAIRAQGQKWPNPRQQILLDLETLITPKRQEGFCPILMMDVDGDTHHPTAPDTDLREFLERTNLVPYFTKS